MMFIEFFDFQFPLKWLEPLEFKSFTANDRIN